MANGLSSSLVGVRR